MSLPSVAFRTDASLDIGSGHVMRCLTLADALRAQGATSRFICREQAGHLIDLIQRRGHAVSVLALAPAAPLPTTGRDEPPFAHSAWLGVPWPVDAEQTASALADSGAAGPVDWLVVDHYALGRAWESALRPHCRRLMAIDDLADRVHDCDLLLDQNLGRDAADYAGKLPADCTVLTGPRHALLRPDFAASRAGSLARRARPALNHLLISMGGVDRDDATGRVLDALKASDEPGVERITVVMGGRAPWIARVRARAAAMPWPCDVRVDVDDMAALMADSDLAIGAAGSSAWERCCLGLPTLMMVLADNQRQAASHLEQAGAASALPADERLGPSLRQLIAGLAREPARLAHMGAQAARITDGLGTQRVLAAWLAH
jgi:UDP-2,4-diacetamido-2,4,6-trideoxy-beta-L-altropyranose hydrolase